MTPGSGLTAVKVGDEVTYVARSARTGQTVKLWTLRVMFVLDDNRVLCSGGYTFDRETGNQTPGAGYAYLNRAARAA